MEALLVNGGLGKSGYTYTALKVLAGTPEVRRCAALKLAALEARAKMGVIRFQMRHLPHWRGGHMKDKEAQALMGECKARASCCACTVGPNI